MATFHEASQAVNTFFEGLITGVQAQPSDPRWTQWRQSYEVLKACDAFFARHADLDPRATRYYRGAMGDLERVLRLGPEGGGDEIGAEEEWEWREILGADYESDEDYERNYRRGCPRWRVR